MDAPAAAHESRWTRFCRFVVALPQTLVAYLRSINWRRKWRSMWRAIRKNWAILTAIGVAFWAIFTWSNSEQRASELRTFEARKPFLERQLIIHFELADVVGKLVALEPSTEEWKVAERRLRELDVGGLQMVANDAVLNKVQNIKKLIKTAKEKTAWREFFLETEARELAQELRAAVDSTWSRKGVDYSYYLPEGWRGTAERTHWILKRAQESGTPADPKPTIAPDEPSSAPSQTK